MWTSIADDGLPRVPTFSDFAVQHPEQLEVDPRLMKMSANLRYTTDTDFLIFKRRNVQQHGYGQFLDICRDLVRMPEYSGPDFSDGDRAITACAAANGNGAKPGSATTWRKIATNHHLTFVVRAIASRSGS